MRRLEDKRIIVIAIVATIAIAVLLLSSNRREDEPFVEDDAEMEYISINTFLTNEMSNIESSAKLDRYIDRFLRKWEIKGGSLAVMKEGKLIYAKGYGWANEEDSVRMDPGHILRIASLSKLITATAIMKLQEDSLLSISDKVFGPDGILNDNSFQNFRDKRCANITVDNLLRHQGGFTLRRGDPLFAVRDIMIWEKLDTVPDMDRMIEYVLSQRLGFTPGQSTCYSNAGYLILSKVIERCSGMSYERYCQDSILRPAGCYDMHLAKNLYSDRYPNEVRYYETWDAEPIPAYDNSGDTLYRSYGGNNIEGLYGAGGWVSSPTEFALFVSAIDGRDGSPDIISKESIMQGIAHTTGQLPIGWTSAAENRNWIRTGSLAGSSAVAKNQSDGYIWVFITNTSSWKGSRFSKYIDAMFRNASKGVEWPERNLLDLLAEPNN